MILVTGLVVTLFTLSRTAWPQPASFVSTSVTPPSVMNTATLPPLNVAGFPGVELVRTYRLSLSFTMSMTRGPCGCAACARDPCKSVRAVTAIESEPNNRSTPSRTLRFMSSPPERKTLPDLHDNQLGLRSSRSRRSRDGSKSSKRGTAECYCDEERVEKREHAPGRPALPARTRAMRSRIARVARVLAAR